MKCRLLICLSIVCAACYDVFAQTEHSVDKWVEYIETLAEDIDDEERLEVLYTELSYLAEHPFNLNSVSEAMLKQLPFLSDEQIKSILAYRQRNGYMASVYELKNIESMDWQTIELLLPFVYIAHAEPAGRALHVKNLAAYGRHEAVLRYDRIFPLKQGYLPTPDSVLSASANKQYLGEPFYQSVRYSYTFEDRVQGGFVLEKDAGEPFWNKHRKGYDYYSAHVLLRNMGKLSNLVVGDYKASFGQGLVLSHDFALPMNAFLSHADRRSHGFRRHYSTGESNYFRGIASTLTLERFDVSFFYSYRRIDGTVREGIISAFKTDGLHRLESEVERKGTIASQAYGANIRYESTRFVAGITGLAYDYGKLSVEPEQQPYNVYYFRGSRNLNVSIDYRLQYSTVKLFGETAMSKNGALATLNALQWAPVSFLTGLLIIRSYTRHYQAYYSSAFAQNSMVQNEQGLYAGMKIVPAKRWQITGYADFFRFPWTKYGIDTPSTGSEYMAQVDYAIGTNGRTYVRYRYRRRESNPGVDASLQAGALPYRQHRVRWQLTLTPRRTLIAQTAIDLSAYHETGGNESNGMMISQNIAWKPRKAWQADAFVAYFHTDDYDSRIISYEKKLLYTYNAAFFYGEGVRCVAVARYFPAERLSVSAKIGWTHYMDRTFSGSGLEAIHSRSRTDLSLLLRWLI